MPSARPEGPGIIKRRRPLLPRPPIISGHRHRQRVDDDVARVDDDVARVEDAKKRLCRSILGLWGLNPASCLLRHIIYESTYS